MQQGLTESSNRDIQKTHLSSPSLQHGPLRSQPDSSDGLPRTRSRSGSPGSSFSPEPGHGVDAHELDHILGRLSFSHGSTAGPRPPAGQRILEYENEVASSQRQSPRPVHGFTVVKSCGAPSSSVQLSEFPNGAFFRMPLPPSLLTSSSRNSDAYHLASPSRFPGGRFPRVKALLCPRHYPLRVAHSLLALLPGSRRPGCLAEDGAAAERRERGNRCYTVRVPSFHTPHLAGLVAE